VIGVGVQIIPPPEFEYIIGIDLNEDDVTGTPLDDVNSIAVALNTQTGVASSTLNTSVSAMVAVNAGIVGINMNASANDGALLASGVASSSPMNANLTGKPITGQSMAGVSLSGNSVNGG
jgi:hypothetical protein